MTARPAATKGAVSRVATLKPWSAATAANEPGRFGRRRIPCRIEIEAAELLAEGGEFGADFQAFRGPHGVLQDLSDFRLGAAAM